MTERHTPQTIEELLRNNRKWHERVVDWFRTEGNSWAESLLLHAALLLVFGLFFGRTIYHQVMGDAPVIEAPAIDTSLDPWDQKYEIGNAPLEPTEIDLTAIDPPGQTAIYYNDAEKFELEGGGSAAGKNDGSAGLGVGSFITGLGPVPPGAGGADLGKGTGTDAGRGGAGTGFGFRGQGHRDGIPGGSTRQSERAVAGALNWLARHQNPDGSWNTGKFGKGCSCRGQGTVEAVYAGTALGLLPFLAAGQTHKTEGLYQEVVKKAVKWLVRNQNPDGELFDLKHGSFAMYEQGMATIALCEIYGMTGDSALREPAQKAVKFIGTAQNKEGGWRYAPGETPGDTSIFGWQMMAMKSAMMAGLEVNQDVMHKGQQWLMNEAHAGTPDPSTGTNDPLMVGRFKYQPSNDASLSMTAVGLLITQYMGAERNDPILVGGVKYLMANLPKMNDRSIYYWYHATQVMHNMQGPDWDAWNRHTRRILIESQIKDGCASGSWDPDKPVEDYWGQRGGRLMMTSLSALTLEVYYRYLPLFTGSEAGQENSKETKK